MPKQKKPPKNINQRLLISNRRAYYSYDIMETIEAGVMLTGTEIKSLRVGRMNIQHSFAKVLLGEVWLLNSHIAPYDQGNVHNHDPIRQRKLLLHAKQIAYLSGSIGQRGLTLIPLRVYIKNHVAKVLLGLARGRKLHDKRRAMIDKEQNIEISRRIRSGYKMP